MAHTKAKGSTRNGRDSSAQRLGVKTFGSTTVSAGQVLIRQRGSKYYAGDNVGIGSDDTLFAKIAGMVRFQAKKVRTFNSQLTQKRFIHIDPIQAGKK